MSGIDLFGRPAVNAEAVQAAFEGIRATLDKLDANVLSDMQVLLDKQIDTIEALKLTTDAVGNLITANEKMAKAIMKRRGNSNFTVFVAVGAGVFAGYKLSTYLRKDNKNG